MEDRSKLPIATDVLVSSRALGPLTREQLQAALDQFGLGRLITAAPIASGNWGQNCFVSSSTGEFVLRGAPFYQWQLLEEQFFGRLLHEHTQAPVPWPYFVEQSTDLFGWPYALMARLPGEQLDGLVKRRQLTVDDRLRLADQMGAALADVQELTWPVAGKFDPSMAGIRPCAAFNPSAESIKLYALPPGLDAPAYAREFLARSRRAAPDRTTAADEVWVESVIARAAAALPEPFTPCCVLPDYQETNAAAMQDAAGDWQLSGLFDLMGASFGDGEKALCRQLRGYLGQDPALAVAYARAYFARRPPRPGVRERLALYLLADALTIWEWAQRSQRIWWDPSLTLRQWLGDDEQLDHVLAQALSSRT